jgi:hypothetical protein
MQRTSAQAGNNAMQWSLESSFKFEKIMILQYGI